MKKIFALLLVLTMLCSCSMPEESAVSSEGESEESAVSSEGESEASALESSESSESESGASQKPEKNVA